MDINKLLEFTINKKASDLHFLPGVPPMIRVNGILSPIAGIESLTKDQVKEFGFLLW